MTQNRTVDPNPNATLGRGKKLAYYNPPTSDRVCDYAFIYLRRSLTKAGIPVEHSRLRNTDKMIFISKALAKLKVLRHFFQVGKKAYLVPILYLSEFLSFPKCFFHEIVTFSYDCWPKRWDDWEAFFRRHKVKVAFISAKQSVAEMQKRLPHMDVIWMPECVDPSDYRPAKQLVDRKIDVLELGRKYDAFHSQIEEQLKASGKIHLFEKVRGQVVFPTYDELIEGLSDSKLLVCFPATMTHADFAGHVETATQRYFQTFASRIIPFGHAPAELVDLFGYNPVVELDMNDPMGQIEHILTHLADYQPLVDKNYQRFLEVGTFDVRLGEMLDALRKRGYDVPSMPKS